MKKRKSVPKWQWQSMLTFSSETSGSLKLEHFPVFKIYIMDIMVPHIEHKIRKRKKNGVLQTDAWGFIAEWTNHTARCSSQNVNFFEQEERRAHKGVAVLSGVTGEPGVLPLQNYFEKVVISPSFLLSVLISSKWLSLEVVPVETFLLKLYCLLISCWTLST